MLNLQLLQLAISTSGCGGNEAWLRATSSKERSGAKKMVNRCVAAGCSNTPSDRVSLFRFPKDKVLRNKWEKQVQRTRAKWKVTEHSYLCSEHFTEDSFEVDSEIASKFGLKKRRRLKSGAVPTIFHRPPVLEQAEK